MSKITLGTWLIIIGIVVTAGWLAVRLPGQKSETGENRAASTLTENEGGLAEQEVHPLSIEYLKGIETSGSEIVVEQRLSPGNGYSRQIVSYRSEGLKIYALLTIPQGDAPEGGWPGMVFNHGYIQPSVYRTTEKYVAYLDAFARAGMVVMKPDYRGHGNSEGQPTGAYGSPGYTVDVLNAFESLQQHESVNPERIGMWGHSMGGYITLRAMVVNPEIKAGVIWGGVVGSYPDLLSNWPRTRSRAPSASPGRGRWRDELLSLYGNPETNPEFWRSISANSYLNELTGPIQLHHGEADSSVPVEFSRTLFEELEAVGKEAELYIYQGDDHNISRNLSTALARSVDFFRRVLNS